MYMLQLYNRMDTSLKRIKWIKDVMMVGDRISTFWLNMHCRWWDATCNSDYSLVIYKTLRSVRRVSKKNTKAMFVQYHWTKIKKWRYVCLKSLIFHRLLDWEQSPTTIKGQTLLCTLNLKTSCLCIHAQALTTRMAKRPEPPSEMTFHRLSNTPTLNTRRAALNSTSFSLLQVFGRLPTCTNFYCTVTLCAHTHKSSFQIDIPEFFLQNLTK